MREKWRNFKKNCSLSSKISSFHYYATVSRHLLKIGNCRFPTTLSKRTRKKSNFVLHEPVAGFFLVTKNIFSGFVLHNLKVSIVKIFSSSVFSTRCYLVNDITFRKNWFLQGNFQNVFPWIWTCVCFGLLHNLV